MSDTAQHLANRYRKRVPVIRDSRAPVAKAADIAGPEWTQTKEAALNAATQRLDVRAFGTIGSADDTDAFLAAMAAAQASGGGIVTSPADGHRFTRGFEVPSGVYLEFNGSGNTELDFRDVTTPVAGSAIYGTGTRIALPALAEDIGIRARTITFTEPPDVAPGDLIQIYNTVDGSFHPARFYYRNGEFARVASVSENTVTLATQVYASYLADGTVTVSKILPWRGGVRGATMRFASGMAGIYHYLPESVVYDDLVMSGSNYAHLQIIQGFDLAISGVHVWDNSPIVAGKELNYGITLANCQNVYASGNFLETSRHGLTLTGGVQEGCVPNRNITVQGGRIGNTVPGANIMGLNMHANVEYVEFLDVDMPAGVTISGDHTYVRGKIRTGPTGKAIVGSGLKGWSHTIEATIDVTANMTQSTDGLVYFDGTADIARSNGTLDLDLKINNRGYMGVPGDLRRIVYVVNRGNPLNDAKIHVDARTTIPALHPNNALGIALFAAANTGWRNVDLSGTLVRCGVLVSASPYRIRLKDMLVSEPPGTGIQVSPISTPYFPHTLIYSKDNLVTSAGQTGIDYHAGGVGGGRIVSDGDEATNCNQDGSGSSYTGSSIYLHDAKDVVYRDAIVGDTKSTTTQARADAINNVGTLWEVNTVTLGSITSRNRTNIGTTNTPPF